MAIMHLSFQNISSGGGRSAIASASYRSGVGKTTLTFNYGEWLAEHGNKVLFMDLDHQSNLSQTYNIYATENTCANIFSGQGQVDIHEVSA